MRAGHLLPNVSRRCDWRKYAPTRTGWVLKISLGYWLGLGEPGRAKHFEPYGTVCWSSASFYQRGRPATEVKNAQTARENERKRTRRVCLQGQSEFISDSLMGRNKNGIWVGILAVILPNDIYSKILSYFCYHDALMFFHLVHWLRLINDLL